MNLLSKEDLHFKSKLSNCLLCDSEVSDAFISIDNYSGMSLKGFSYSYCSNCDYYFVNPQPSLEGLNTYYNGHGPITNIESMENSISLYLNQGGAYQFVKQIGENFPPPTKSMQNTGFWM
ncbi:hypothetical protein WDW89_15040 [Deltaproteobacteria bacterium TL4]